MEKEQILSDKQQLEQKIYWLANRTSSTAHAEESYRRIKKFVQIYLFKTRLLKLVRGGNLDAFKLNSKKRKGKLQNIVCKLAGYGSQLQVLFNVYCVPMEAFFQKNEFDTHLDPKGWNFRDFQVYKRAIHQMALLFKQVGNQASAVV